MYPIVLLMIYFVAEQTRNLTHVVDNINYHMLYTLNSYYFLFDVYQCMYQLINLKKKSETKF